MSGLTQREIASAMGYDRPNIVSMFKRGSTRVPLERVPSLAAALDLPPSELVRRWLQDYAPALLPVLGTALGARLAENESALANGAGQNALEVGLSPGEARASSSRRQA